ncbi:MAG: serine hydrolase [Desulfobacteraceae bacterium]|nr:MAG: serine hydrolase [Desulfobacteraceae bacterium]
MEKINSAMIDAISDNVFPGAVLLVSVKNKVLFFDSYGLANRFSGKKMSRDIVFDLASLTKPLATTLAVMKLVQKGKLGIEDKLASILPLFRNTDKEGISIINLLSHNSGIPDYRPYYLSLSGLPQNKRENALRDLLVKEPLLSMPGENVLYSDLGFMILRWVVETVSESRLDRFVYDNIYKPLGLEKLFFVDLAHEANNGKERNESFAATEICPWRNILLEGVVHDENSFVMGGIEGHAGLFGTAGDANLLLSEILFSLHGISKKAVIDGKQANCFLRRREGAVRALGFDAPSLTGSSSGIHFSRNSVGHLGFTGTSFWMDLDNFVIIILFTNRVHPSRENVKIKEFRPVLHDIIMETLAGKGIIKI